ncbi:MAG: carbohydrate ABC transporter permease [Spirochaetales bacterium]|jgi:multiple sugar transport system permease protein|nr:carbohydrate ABC transporter permease [Spirochaetales bacterium]
MKSVRLRDSLAFRKKTSVFFRYFGMAVLGIFFLFPIVFLLVSSLKPEELVAREMSSIMAFIPRQVSLQNYFDVFHEMPFLRFMMNSIIIVGSIVSLGIIVNSMAAYAFSRLRWRGRDAILTVILASMIIPFESISIPLLLEVNRFGWIDTYFVQIIVFIAIPLYIFLFYQFFLNIPKDIETAARIDGAGNFTIFFRIVLPISKPVIATVAILSFIQQWGNFLWPLMVTRGFEVRPLPVAMQTFFGMQPRIWGDIMAFASMITIPVLILFLLFQKWFIKSVASSGIKG